ncbi:MAG: GLPGLI family protein [Tannerellaceae bacterium]|nr:GLPGLI family protein [Tannerellaceae bacterium]
MKKICFLSVVLYTLCFPGIAQMNIRIFDASAVLNKKAVDRTQFTVQYEMEWVSDTSKPDKRETETMMLKVGEKSSQFYSYAKFRSDSILEADKAAGVPQEVIIEHMNQNMGKLNYEIYKNYPEGKVTTIDEISITKIKCEEKNDVPVWEITNDTLTILSYPCRKAITHFKGREYVAWYTDEIPRSEGPWKLNGLPGFILKAEDTKGEYAFTCTGIQLSRTEDPILFGDTHCEPVSRKEYDKIYERFMADPVGYIAQNAPHVKLSIKSDSGENVRPKQVPYNPIELNEK